LPYFLFRKKIVVNAKGKMKKPAKVGLFLKYTYSMLKIKFGVGSAIAAAYDGLLNIGMLYCTQYHNVIF
jgi:hypothetical protein